MIPGDMLTEAQRRCIPDVSFELIPIRNLVSNQEYQRPLSENHIRKALEEFDVYQINPVKVSRRDGINYVFDGQHTIEIIASESGSRDTPVWCMIYHEADWNGGKVYMEDDYPHILFAKDSELYKLNGLFTFVVGGAYSVDKNYRLLHGLAWWLDEQPSDEIKRQVEEKLEGMDWEVDVVLTHTAPLKFEPTEVFLPMIDQSTVDKSTEQWLDSIEEQLYYDRWYRVFQQVLGGM